MEVSPPGIITKSVFTALRAALALAVQWARKESNTSIFRVPGFRVPQTEQIQSKVRGSSIQPFSWTRTIRPGGYFSFGRVFLLKITYGGSFVLSAVHASITIVTELLPTKSTVQFVGRWNIRGVWPALSKLETGY